MSVNRKDGIIRLVLDFIMNMPDWLVGFKALQKLAVLLCD